MFFQPTVHGVILNDDATFDTPEEAFSAGLEFQERCRERLGDRRVALDLDALRIRGRDVPEYRTPQGPE